MYIFTDPDIFNTLCWIASQNANDPESAVKVTLVHNKIPDDSGLHTEFRKLSACGVDVRFYDPLNKYSLHTKIAIIDEHTVLCGAANWTTKAFRDNVEDMLIVRDEQIARRYCDFLRPIIEAATPYQPELTRQERRHRPADPTRLLARGWEKKLANSPLIAAFPLPATEDLTIYFSPHVPYSPRLCSDLSDAKEKIQVAVYIYVHTTLHACLTQKSAASQRTLTVHQSNYTHPSIRPLLQDAFTNDVQLHVCFLDNKDGDCMHLKAAVIDDAIVWRGSGNWSTTADRRNYEETMRIHCPHIARFYADYIMKIQAEHCRPLRERDFR